MSVRNPALVDSKGFGHTFGVVRRPRGGKKRDVSSMTEDDKMFRARRKGVSFMTEEDEVLKARQTEIRNLQALLRAIKPFEKFRRRECKAQIKALKRAA